ncbi:MAG: L-2-amino-thiazoline-4-carboxylic acid hydrolase [Candidatus Thorarchaeota archaeon]
MGISLSDNPNLRKLVREIRSVRNHPFRLKQLLAEYEANYGEDANSAVLQIVAEDTRRIWAGIAYDKGSNSLDDLLDCLWIQFEDTGGEFALHHEDGAIHVCATKCPIADVYKRIGKESLGMLFHCSSDPFIVEGFNDSIEFSLAKTLMEGDDYCDHRYSLKN